MTDDAIHVPQRAIPKEWVTGVDVLVPGEAAKSFDLIRITDEELSLGNLGVSNPLCILQ